MQLNKGNVIVKIGNGGGEGETFAAISEATEIAWDGFQYDTEDVTTHNSTDRAKQMVTTLYSSGKVTFTIIYDPENTEHAALDALKGTGAPHNFQLVITNILENTFEAFVESMVPDMAIGSTFKYKVVLLVNGAMSED